MGMDVCRYIEVYTPDYIGYVNDKKYLNYIGKFKVGDVIMVYNGDDHYWRITNIIAGVFTYEPIVYVESDELNDLSIKKYSNFIDSLNIVHRCEFVSDLPKTQLSCKEGDIYKYWESGEKYAKYTNGKWVDIESCPYSWKPIVWDNQGKKKNCIDSGCSFFINNYISRYSTSDCMNYSCRGLPKDVTEETKNSISEYEFDHTYVNLDELMVCCKDILQTLKNSIYNYVINSSNNIISKKLDIIIEKLFNNNNNRNISEDEETKEDLDECLEESLRDYEIANSEYVMISSFVENIYGYVSDKNIRVIYTFSN